MPIYTYRCESCGVQFERQQSFSDAPLKTCPECRKKSLKKVMTPVGIVFKGSGFYATDHKSPSGQVKRENKKETPTTENKETKEAKESKEPKETRDSKETKPAAKESSE
jgi:putative FmdB family regulatory protein